jgi:hypothetical protein
MKPTCIDLRPWAKEHRYRWRWEESRRLGEDDPLLVEVVCHNGLIYPSGGTILLAYVKGGVVNRVAELGPDLQPYQTDRKNRVFKFPIERLDEVAAILRPRKRRSVVLTPEQVEARRETLRLAREARKSLSPGGTNGLRNATKWQVRVKAYPYPLSVTAGRKSLVQAWSRRKRAKADDEHEDNNPQRDGRSTWSPVAAMN